MHTYAMEWTEKRENAQCGNWQTSPKKYCQPNDVKTLKLTSWKVVTIGGCMDAFFAPHEVEAST